MSKLTRLRGDRGQTSSSFLGVALVAAAVIALVLAAASPMFFWTSTGAGEVALSYGGGPFEGSAYQDTVGPGSGMHANGWFDKWYTYDITQRDFTIATQPEADSNDLVATVTKDGVVVRWEIGVAFKLNTSRLRQFHQEIGLKFHAYDSAGWRRMLAVVFRPQIERSLRVETAEFNADELYGDAEALRQVERGVAQTLTDSINENVGAPYFCGPNFDSAEALTQQPDEVNCTPFTVTLGRPLLPDDLAAEYNRQATAERALLTEQANTATREERARGEQAVQEAVRGALTPEYLDYLRAKALQSCADSPNCTIVYGLDGGVSVPTG